MKRFRILLGVLSLSVLVVPANAGWTEVTSSWNAQGVGDGWGLVSDGTTLYAFNNTSAKVYDAATDTWSALASATKTVHAAGDSNGTQVYYDDGKFYFRTHGGNGSYISIYDIANNSWNQPDIELGSYSPCNYSQGTVYDPTTGTLWSIWTSWQGGTEYLGYNSYDTTTGTFGTAAGGTWGSPDNFSGKMRFGNNRPGVIVDLDGTYYYYKLSDQGTSPYMQRVAFGWDDPTEATTETLAQLTGNSTSLGDSGAWGTRQLAVLGTDIYVTGADTSGFFAVYHCDTNEWEILESYNNGSGGYRTHTMAIADGVVYVEDGSQFFAYSIPEPATMSLLGLGGLGLLIRRKR